MSEISDEDLMLRVQGDEIRLLGVLFERHHRRIFNYFLRMTGQRNTAEDLASETFMRVLKYRHSYRREAKFTTWLYQVGRNIFLDHVEKQRPEDSLDDLPAHIQVDTVRPDDTLQSSQETRLIRLALDRLPERKREVLILSRYRDMKYEEIAQVMGTTAAAVKILVHRSLRDLKEIYQEISQGGAR
jgi:RNA polymerase sigma-70 factor (ECF subfamily)